MPEEIIHRPRLDPILEQLGPESLAIVKVLAYLDEGNLLPILRGELRKVCQACELTGKGGKVKLAITVKPAGKGNDALKLSVVVDSNVPRPDAIDRIFFVDPDGEISRHNPRQRTLPIDQE